MTRALGNPHRNTFRTVFFCFDYGSAKPSHSGSVETATTMKTIVILTLLFLSLLLNAAIAGEQTPGVVITPAITTDPRVFEMRTYYAAPGRLEALHARFRDHTCKLFEKHGMANLGYWMPVENPDNKIIYVLAYPGRDAREKSWKEFMADPDWQAACKASEKDGKLVDKAESVFLSATDYSPQFNPAAGRDPRLFELRTYTATPGKLGDLHERFRRHTCDLFAQHGMENVAYWVPMPDQKGAADTLIYIVAHRNPDAAKASWDGFRKDPDWVAARKASEEKAGGSLTIKDGVKSVFMKPTDYSPTK